MFMKIRWSKTQNFAWEPGLLDLSHLNYGKKCGSQLLTQNAPNMQIFQKCSRLFMVALWNRADHYIFILSFVLSSSYGRPM